MQKDEELQKMQKLMAKLESDPPAVMLVLLNSG